MQIIESIKLKNSPHNPTTDTCEVILLGGAEETAGSSDFSRRLVEEVPFLRRIVRRWHRVSADAEDLVQDTLLRALIHADQWQPGTNLRAWLFTIMRNQFLGKKAVSIRADAAMQSHPDLNSKTALGRQDARLLLRDTQRVVARLPQIQQAALLLVGAEGRSHEAVADALDISVGALRCHLTRARARLRKAVHDVELTSPLAPKPAPPRRERPAVFQFQLVE